MSVWEGVSPEMQVRLCEQAVSAVRGRPYADLRAEAVASGAREEDLLGLGRQIVEDSIRLARGGASAVLVPPRPPRTGEHRWPHYLQPRPAR